MLSQQDVIDLIVELDFDVDQDAITGQATLKSLGIDSLDVFTLLVEIEAKTGRKIPDDDVENLTSIDSIVEYFS